jgi:hypothetical protein
MKLKPENRDMKFNILTGVAATALALSTAAAFAQTQVMPQPYIGGYQAAPGPYYGGTGSTPQQAVTTNIGGYQSAPGPYYGGTGSAHATAQPYIGGYEAAPGPYYGGTGSAQKSAGNQYNQGSAQTLPPTSEMGQPVQTGQNVQTTRSQ